MSVFERLAGRSWGRLALALLLGWAGSSAWTGAFADGLGARRGSGTWEHEIAEFERLDRLAAPPAGSVVFVGSSSIASWSTLARDLAPLPIVNRGLGGTHFDHIRRYAPRIVLPYAPRAVVIYAGDNDLDEGTGKTAESVLEDFRRFASVVQESFPETAIYVLAIKPSPLRWTRWREMRRSNALIAGFAFGRAGIEFVDVATPMLDDDGELRKSLYASDGLHLSREGYALWTSVLRPILMRDLYRDAERGRASEAP